VTTKAETN